MSGSNGRRLFHAGRLLDAEGRGGGRHGPGAALVARGRLVAAGDPARIGRPADAEIVQMPDAVVVPALVNAHCHLDLSHLGPRPFGGDFVGWIDGIRRGRVSGVDAIAASVRLGAQLSRAGGTALVGDIAGGASRIPARELARAGLAGVSFLEVFGAGPREREALATLAAAAPEIRLPVAGSRPGGWGAWTVRLGASPHAPYSCSPCVYRAAAGLGVPVTTHLAETPEEEEFLATGSGPLAEYISRFRLLDETPAGRHPVEHLSAVLRRAAAVAAHVQYVQERHLGILAATRTTVAYCPRAAAYFGHPRGGRPGHRYREMLEAGVNVALGTDGLPCLDTPDRISVLDEMRFLFRRDRTDPMTLLHMATVAGARGLGFDPDPVTLAPGPTAGLLAIPFDPADPADPLEQILTRDDPPTWIVGGN